MARKRTRRKMTNKQALITIISVVAAAALLIVALAVIGAINKDAINDPHAGHNHGSELGDGHYEGDGHDHGTADTGVKAKYQLYQEEGGTYRMVFRDDKGKSLAEFNKIANPPIKEAVDEKNGIYELGWSTGKGPNDFACVYYNEKTGQVSDMFTAPRGTDGVRIAYGSADQKKVIVRDLFNKDGYSKEYALEGAVANKNGDIIISGRLTADKKAVSITYLIGPDTHLDNRKLSVNLYE